MNGQSQLHIMAIFTIYSNEHQVNSNGVIAGVHCEVSCLHIYMQLVLHSKHFRLKQNSDFGSYVASYSYVTTCIFILYIYSYFIGVYIYIYIYNICSYSMQKYRSSFLYLCMYTHLSMNVNKTVVWPSKIISLTMQVFSKVGSEISISSLNYIKVTGPEKWTKLAQNTPNHKTLNILGSVYSISFKTPVQKRCCQVKWNFIWK